MATSICIYEHVYIQCIYIGASKSDQQKATEGGRTSEESC